MRQSDYKNLYKRAEDIRLMDVKFPRPVQSMHQIELTSRCNLRCSYCPSKDLKRPKVDMDRKTFVRCLEWASHFVNRGTQIELNLAGLGESTLHPDFVEYIGMAREAVGWNTIVTLATNGILMDEAMVTAIKPFHPLVWVSLHKPEKASKAVHYLKEAGIFSGVSVDPATNSNDWAGQVDWPVTQEYQNACQWLRHGFVMALADGRITTCCLDASGSGVIGHVDDAIPSVKTKPYNLCSSCCQHIRIIGYEQRLQNGGPNLSSMSYGANVRYKGE